MLFKPLPVTGNTEKTAPENHVFFPALDGLRAIAFLMVFLQHYIQVPWGWSGVNIFFVLSGFLITGILTDTRDEPHRAWNFYIRRTLRIFPLYYGIFLALLLAAPFMHWNWTKEWWEWPLYVGNFLRFQMPLAGVGDQAHQMAADAFLISPQAKWAQFHLGHFWSLCVEEQFYLLWPWLVFWIRSRKAMLWLCGTVVVGMPLVRILADHIAPQWMLGKELLYRATPFQLDSLLLGELVALLWRGAHRDLLLRIGRIGAWICLALVVVYLACTIKATSIAELTLYHYPSWRLTTGLTFINLLAASLILACLQPGTAIARFLKLYPLRWLGRISYGAYVFHDIPHTFYVGVVTHYSKHFPVLTEKLSLFTTLLGLPCTLLIAWLSFRFFESPFLNLKERLTRRPEPALPMAS